MVARAQPTPEQAQAFNQIAGPAGFIPTQPWRWLLTSPCKTTLLLPGNRFGKNECLSILTPVSTTKGRVLLGDLYEDGKPFSVYAWDGKKPVETQASPPFKKDGGPKPCYRVTMRDGQWFECSSEHHLLSTSSVFCSFSDIYDSFLSFGLDQEEQLVHTVDGQRSIQKLLDFLACYLRGSYLCGERLLWETGIGQVPFPSQADALGHIYHHEMQKGGPGSKYASIFQSLLDRLSNLYDGHHFSDQYVEFSDAKHNTSFRQLLHELQVTTRILFGSSGPLRSIVSVWRRVLQSVGFLRAFDTPFVLNGNRIITIESIPSQEIYDFTVRNFHNYITSDLVHHNSGVMDYFLRVACKHPQAWKNIHPDDKSRTLRIACATLPNDKEGEEVRNTVYPVIKRRFPPLFIRKDITARSPVLRVCNGFSAEPTREVQMEFVSYGQSGISQAGVSRRAVWQDEESNQDFFEEQQARTMDTGGDMIITFTPIPGQIGWMYDQLYERARLIYRTEAVRRRFKERFGENYPEVEERKGKDDICVIMAATDDNPYFDSVAAQESQIQGRLITRVQYLEDWFRNKYGDEDVIDARRFGIFRQLSGRIHKSFASVHVISGQKYFPMGVPHEWRHFRGVDYHQAVPWAGVWLAVSPRNEIFVYRDGSWSPERMMTYDIAAQIADMSGRYRFVKNLIDPLSKQTQVNTNTTTLDDLNRFFHQFKQEDRGTGGYWQGWDTKGTRGREEMTQRLLNASKVGRPFNNEVETEGRRVTLPTIWFLDDCKRVIECMKNWRYEDPVTREGKNRHMDDDKKPQSRWSHHPIAIECLLKDNAVTHVSSGASSESRDTNRYFNTRR